MSHWKGDIWKRRRGFWEETEGREGFSSFSVAVEVELSSSPGTGNRIVFGVWKQHCLAESRSTDVGKILPFPSTSKETLCLHALQLQLMSLLKPPCLQKLRKYWMCLTSSTNVKHKWSWVNRSSSLKHVFETRQSSKLAYTPCAVIHSLLFCISVCFNEVVQCSSSESKTYDAP